MAQPTPTPEQLRTFVGPRADYYLKRWERLAADSSEPLGFNWSAFFLGPFWLLYRRMYRTFWIVMGVILTTAILEDLSFRGEPPRVLDGIINLAFATFFGVFGTHLYYVHARRRITALTAGDGVDPQVLTNAGGVKWIGVLVLLAVVLVVVGLLVAFSQFAAV